MIYKAMLFSAYIKNMYCWPTKFRQKIEIKKCRGMDAS